MEYLYSNAIEDKKQKDLIEDVTLPGKKRFEFITDLTRSKEEKYERNIEE
jgi:hypothetical protein